MRWYRIASSAYYPRRRCGKWAIISWDCHWGNTSSIQACCSNKVRHVLCISWGKIKMLCMLLWPLASSYIQPHSQQNMLYSRANFSYIRSWCLQLSWKNYGWPVDIHWFIFHGVYELIWEWQVLQNFLSNIFKVQKLSVLPLCEQEVLHLINNFDSKEANRE